LYIRAHAPTEIKVKKRLVPFTEKIPENLLLRPLVALVPNLAELNFSSRGNEYISFSNADSTLRTTPVICYGSVFSTFTAREIRESGSNYMAVIMNEGWMLSRKAHLHFTWFSVCRAVENRRFLVKSSNEGLTALVDARGRVLDSRQEDEEGTILGLIDINEQHTFYTKHHQALLLLILTVSLVAIGIIVYPGFKGKRAD
jgi:apolipoprotein N-acyltransferase